jgi:hypothetical protein
MDYFSCKMRYWFAIFILGYKSDYFYWESTKFAMKIIFNTTFNFYWDFLMIRAPVLITILIIYIISVLR